MIGIFVKDRLILRPIVSGLGDMALHVIAPSDLRITIGHPDRLAIETEQSLEDTASPLIVLRCPAVVPVLVQNRVIVYAMKSHSRFAPAGVIGGLRGREPCNKQDRFLVDAHISNDCAI